MKQGYSGSTVRREGNFVVKVSSDQDFLQNKERQADLIALSQKTSLLPRIAHIRGEAITMEYVEGQEELTLQNASRAGAALRMLHELPGYPHECFTGVDWLIELANESLAKAGLSSRIDAHLAAEYPNDALIHSEPAQFVEKQDGSIIFIDFEGIGMGSRYQDLGFVYYVATKDEEPEIYARFIEGYQSTPIPIELRRVKKMAGIISLAYAGFAEFEKRVQLGLSLISEVENSLAT
jgi:hypothetical protein